MKLLSKILIAFSLGALTSCTLVQTESTLSIENQSVKFFNTSNSEDAQSVVLAFTGTTSKDTRCRINETAVTLCRLGDIPPLSSTTIETQSTADKVNVTFYRKSTGSQPYYRQASR